MRIAFISYELPPNTPVGGIGTYVHQAARMLTSRGHYVEVFAGSDGRIGMFHQDGYVVQRVQGSRDEFPIFAGQLFASRNQLLSFDVLEGSEYYAEAREAVRLVPNIPLVVRLHTSQTLVKLINIPAMSIYRRFRFWFGAKRRGGVPFWETPQEEDYERKHTYQADEIVAPSKAIAGEMRRLWGLDMNRISVYGNPFEPSEAMLAIPVDQPGAYVTFIGRLERRKGITEFAEAIPRILRKMPATIFRFIGRDLPNGRQMMSDLLRQLMGSAAHAAEFIPQVSADQLPNFLRESAVCVFPSRWENFPYVCLEAMSAGRAVVGSSAGGMAEQLDFGKCGVLIPPFAPRKIADAVVYLLGNSGIRRDLGDRARKRVVECFNYSRIGVLQEQSYVRAINRRRSLGSRAGGCA